jgi:CRISPR/Cas system-associated protein endoribonuclease Cas2
MSISKDENWDHLAQEHEKFVENAIQNGYPMWMISMYSSLPMIQDQQQKEEKDNELPF